MPRERHVLAMVRMAAICLVAVAMLVGPLGIGTSAASVTAKACGVSCPCEDTRLQEQGDEASHGDACKGTAGSEHHDENLANDECPEDCPDCSCCLGVVLGVVPRVMPVGALLSHASTVLTPPESPASGADSGVFRPPRSRA